MGSAASAFQWCGPGPRIPYGPAVYDLAATEAGHMAAPDHAQQSALRFFLHRRGRPHMALRHPGVQSLTAQRPAAKRRHVGLGPGLVDEHQTLRIDAALIGLPLRPPARHVGPVAFAGHHGFFYS
jgi:hypothetical protein